MNDIIIDDFSEKYLNAGKEILYETLKLHAQKEPWQFHCSSKEKSVPYLNEIINNPENFGLIAFNDGTPAGLLLAGIGKRDENIYRCQKYIQIYDIVVSNHFKKHGIGRKLIAQAVQKAHSLNIRQIELEVFNFNKEAAAFYKKMHFRELSRTMGIRLDNKSSNFFN